MTDISNSSAVLLLNYQRPELTRKRLNELSLLVSDNLKIVCSVDGLSTLNAQCNKEFQEMEKEFSKFEWVKEKKKLGLANHLFARVSETLQSYNSVFVVEDDIETCPVAVQSAIEQIRKINANQSLTAGLFGALTGKFARYGLSNKWRTTRYFSAWGWGTSKHVWSEYNLKIVKQHGIRSLKGKPLWETLSEIQKSRWVTRFNRVVENPQFTWDFQMQFLGFLSSRVNYLPTFRMCENEGFNDLRATNTSAKRPNWYRGYRTELPIQNQYQNLTVNRYLEFVDSITWLGDKKIFDGIGLQTSKLA